MKNILKDSITISYRTIGLVAFGLVVLVLTCFISLQDRQKALLAKVPVSQPTIAASPTPVYESPVKTTPGGGLVGILKKKVAQPGDMCNNVAGTVMYMDADKEDINTMIIVSTNSQAPEEVKKKWKEVQSYLNGNEKTSTSILSNIKSGLRYGCGGASYEYISDLPISYPQTDKSKALMAMAGQDPYGSISVIVIAQKDDELILLESYLSDKSLYLTYEKSCPTFEDVQWCYRDKIFKDPFYKELATRKAQGLVEEFLLSN